MVDHQFADLDLASLYDTECPWDERDDFGFYLPLVMAAGSVLDVGCGTGALLHRARDDGHTGRLCGIDPADGMLAQARKRSDIEWTLGDLTWVAWEQEFDLILMSGHAFQVFLTDDELRIALAAIRAALTDDGCFVFETRNPLVRGWERWVPANVADIGDTGIRRWHDVDLPVHGELVSFTTTYTAGGWDGPRHSRSTLRFLGQERLAQFLTDAGLVIQAQYGDWDRQPVTDTSPEIITVATRGPVSRTA
ncbi:MAG TPA: class I SAM-dependent methyltransferase [Pseudonocardiaceae bacterium]|nr:class I SAM-dependent methyltransferase [Pseudonocardiaceae bacterium]